MGLLHCDPKPMRGKAPGDTQTRVTCSKAECTTTKALPPPNLFCIQIAGWVGDHLRRKLVSSKSIVRLNRLLVQFIPRSACGDLHRTAEVVPPWIYSLRVYRVLLHYIAEHNSMFDCSRSSPTLIIPGTHQRRHERNVVLLVACQIARHLYLLS